MALAQLEEQLTRRAENDSLELFSLKSNTAAEAIPSSLAPRRSMTLPHETLRRSLYTHSLLDLLFKPLLNMYDSHFQKVSA